MACLVQLSLIKYSCMAGLIQELEITCKTGQGGKKKKCKVLIGDLYELYHNLYRNMVK